MIKELSKEEIFKVKNIIEENFGDKIEGLDELTKVFIYDEDIKGLISFSNLYDHFDINYIWVGNDFRKKGIASKLISFMIQDARKNGIKKITLEVSENNNSAIRLYEKFDFKKVARRKNYYKGQDGILMILEVR